MSARTTSALGRRRALTAWNRRRARIDSRAPAERTEPTGTARHLGARLGTLELDVPPEVIQKWQEIVDILAELVRVPAALIMRVMPPEIVVLLASRSEGNPYERGERACLDTGLYCETVMRTRRPLLVPDALGNEAWRTNPDIKLGMISYLGFPLVWPTGEVFGTICVLDQRENRYGQLYQRLLSQFRDLIESDLKSVFTVNTRLAEKERLKDLLEKQVAERTAELTIANERLQQDIVERKRAENALRKSRCLVDAIVDNSAALIYVTDLEGRFLLANRRVEELLRLPRGTAIGKSAHDLFGTGRADALRAFDRRVLAAGSPLEAEELISQEDGLHTYISTKCPLLDVSGEPYAICCVSADITERKRIEGERAALLARERQARRLAEEANRAKNEFLATLSHELRTPLTPILGWTRILRTRRLDDEKMVSALEVIERNAMSQARIVNDLLDISSIITGKLRVDVHTVDLAPIVRAAIDSVRLEADAKALQVRTSLDPLADFVSGDPDRLQQVVNNLLSNSIKFTPRGGRIEVGLTTVGPRVRLTVSDTGKGITPEFLPHVFERFRQADSSATRAYGGLGLGLAIVRQLVEIHGGAVYAESAGEGQGATFTVELPRVERASECAAPQLVVR